MKKTIILSVLIVALITVFSGFRNFSEDSSYSRGLAVEVKRSNNSLVAGAVVNIYESGTLVLGPKTTDCTGRVTWGSGDPIPAGGTTLTCEVSYCGGVYTQNFISPGSSTTVYMNVGNPKCMTDCPND
jgi:hypothetical protein